MQQQPNGCQEHTPLRSHIGFGGAVRALHQQLPQGMVKTKRNIADTNACLQPSLQPAVPYKLKPTTISGNPILLRKCADALAMGVVENTDK